MMLYNLNVNPFPAESLSLKFYTRYQCFIMKLGNDATTPPTQTP
jgi:hypothetical protein